MHVLRWCPFVHLFDTPFQNLPCDHEFVALNSSPLMKADEPAIRYQKVLIFITGLSLFICDLIIKVSNIKGIPSLLTIDLKILFKI